MLDLNMASRPLAWLQTGMEQLLDEVGPRPSAWGSPEAVFPALNSWEDAENYYVEAELPGLKIEDLDLAVAGQELSIRGERKFEQKEGVAWHRRERPWGKFARLIELPASWTPRRFPRGLSRGCSS
jgi:HSP20 family protein